jgi:hypothetical protein
MAAFAASFDTGANDKRKRLWVISVPTGDANIDYVLIGARGLYVTETKTLSKPVRGECRIVVSDSRITANGRPLDRDPIRLGSDREDPRAPGCESCESCPGAAATTAAVPGTAGVAR